MPSSTSQGSHGHAWTATTCSRRSRPSETWSGRGSCTSWTREAQASLLLLSRDTSFLRRPPAMPYSHYAHHGVDILRWSLYSLTHKEAVKAVLRAMAQRYDFVAQLGLYPEHRCVNSWSLSILVLSCSVASP